jgi:hypothetical protein
MKHYIQLKDGVVFNYHQSPDHVDDSGPDVWEVETEASDKLGMNYNTDTKVFSEAELIRYAILNEENIIVLINETKYSSDVKDNIIITNPEVEVLWQWDGTNFVNLIEKNNLEDNARYVESLDRLAEEAEENNTSITLTEEPVIQNNKLVLRHDGEDLLFNSQEELDAFVTNLMEENQRKIDEALLNGIVSEEE